MCLHKSLSILLKQTIKTYFFLNQIIMKNTTIKAAIFALALTVTVGASASSYMFTRSLTVGSKGADVIALQDFLTSTGYYTYAGGSTGYFGSVTRTAVAAYQASKSIMPAAGYFGPLTRASVNNNTTVNPGTVVTTPGCSAGAMFNSMTGASCATTTVTSNCPAGAMFNPMTGAACTVTTTPSTTLNGGEGFGDFRLSPTPVQNTNIQTQNNVPVYGVIVTAKSADIAVQRLTLDVSVLNKGTNGGNENPSTLINSMSISDGTTVLATVPVNSSTFSRYSNSTSLYYVQISGLNVVVPVNTSKTLTVSFNTNSIDVARAATINVSANGVRIVDGRGISTYNGSDIGVLTQTFNKPGNSSVTVSQDATTIYSTNYRIDPNGNGAQQALTSTFAIRSSSGPSQLETVSVSVATTSAIGGVASTPSNLYLYQGSKLLDARTVSATGTVVFNLTNSNIQLPQDISTTFTIKADLPSNTATGTLVMTTVNDVTFQKADGSSQDVSGLTIAGPWQFFAPVVPSLTPNTSVVTPVVNNNIQVGVTANIAMNVMALGGDIVATSTNFTAVIGLKNISNGQVVATSSVDGITRGETISTFPQGASKIVDFTFNATSTQFAAGTTNVRAFVQSLTYRPVGSATSITLPAGGFSPFDSAGYAAFSK
jgi:peptidoglycan hydrolase-like protein with peptidoglycan-binding domain